MNRPAMFAATLAGAYPSVAEAQKAMNSGIAATYTPDPAAAAEYDVLYARYGALGEYVENITERGEGATPPSRSRSSRPTSNSIAGDWWSTPSVTCPR